MPLPDDWDAWDEEQAELVAVFPLRVHKYRGVWVCTCVRFDQEGKCRHLVPFLPKEDVDVKEEFL